MTTRYLFLVFMLLLPGMKAFAQRDSIVYQISGMVINKNTGQPVPYAKVRINASRRGMIADEKGFYSLPVVASDTLVITSIGYKKLRFPLKEYILEYQGDRATPYVYALHYMEEDSIVLPPVTISPYDSPEKIRAAILAMEIPANSAEEQARENLNAAAMRNLVETLPQDSEEKVQINENFATQKYMQGHVVQTLPLLDPFTIARYIRYLSERSKAKKEKIYDYWPEE